MGTLSTAFLFEIPFVHIILAGLEEFTCGSLAWLHPQCWGFSGFKYKTEYSRYGLSKVTSSSNARKNSCHKTDDRGKIVKANSKCKALSSAIDTSNRFQGKVLVYVPT